MYHQYPRPLSRWVYEGLGSVYHNSVGWQIVISVHLDTLRSVTTMYYTTYGEYGDSLFSAATLHRCYPTKQRKIGERSNTSTVLMRTVFTTEEFDQWWKRSMTGIRGLSKMAFKCWYWKDLKFLLSLIHSRDILTTSSYPPTLTRHRKAAIESSHVLSLYT